MKHIFILLFLCATCALIAQQKGVSPIEAGKGEDLGQTYAVVVGISDYQDEGITDLRFADRDAEAFANYLRSPIGGLLDEDHMKVLINEQATQAQVAAALDWLWEVAKEGDQVIIYFSGHGDVEQKTFAQPGFLLCWDAPYRVYMAGGAYPLLYLQEVISTISVQNKAKVILIADACHAGKLSGNSVGGSQITGSNLATQYANEIKILSCQPNEYSIEGEQWGGGRGAFSYHLLDGLYGLADGNKDLSVNLMEIGRYLEDHVTIEVAPETQIPMTIGSKDAVLSKVIPEYLTQIMENKKGQLQMLHTTELKGIEDDVLAEADSSIVELYLAFKEALKNKAFLSPENDSLESVGSIGNYADDYYAVLIKEPSLERLHSSMRRNYAAALQDEAQQVLNIMLKTGLTDQVLKAANSKEIYANYPTYLDRASELLGKEHYMYTALQARKHFFEGILLNAREEKKAAYYKALDFQPNMPHAMVYLAGTFEAELVDSTEYYANKASAMIPSWVEPYVTLFHYYLHTLKQPEKAEEMLQLAGDIDSTSILVWYKKAVFYRDRRNFEEAEKWYLKIIESTGNDICFPCAFLDLGYVYQNQGRYDEAWPHLVKALEIDSSRAENYKSFCRPCTYINMGNNRLNKGLNNEAKQYFGKALQLDSTFALAHYNLGIIYKGENRLKESEESYLKTLKYNKNFAPAWVNIGWIYFESGRLEEAEAAYKKALDLPFPWAHPYAHDKLGIFYMDAGRYEEAEEEFNKSLELNPNHKAAIVNFGLLKIKTNELEKAQSLLDKALEVDPDYPDFNIVLGLLSFSNNQSDEAWQLFEKGLEKGYEGYKGLQTEPAFAEMRKDPRWNELMKKYFPNQHK